MLLILKKLTSYKYYIKKFGPENALIYRIISTKDMKSENDWYYLFVREKGCTHNDNIRTD